MGHDDFDLYDQFMESQSDDVILQKNDTISKRRQLEAVLERKRMRTDLDDYDEHIDNISDDTNFDEYL